MWPGLKLVRVIKHASSNRIVGIELDGCSHAAYPLPSRSFLQEQSTTRPRPLPSMCTLSLCRKKNVYSLLTRWIFNLALLPPFVLYNSKWKRWRKNIKCIRSLLISADKYKNSCLRLLCAVCLCASQTARLKHKDASSVPTVASIRLGLVSSGVTEALNSTRVDTARLL
jgi:hypothetical protein